MKQKKIVFDLDNTLCSRPDDVEHLGIDKYNYCFPISNMVEFCNKLYNGGHYVIIWTSRGMTSLDGNERLINEILKPITKYQLKEWGVKYHELRMGKPHYDVFICDKAVNPHQFDFDTFKSETYNLIY